MAHHRTCFHGMLSCLATALAVLAGGAWAAEEPGKEPRHLGVASCASSTCHGRVEAAEDSPVALNEYFIWSKYDSHANAFEVLQGDWSQRIAANMGLENAASAEECLVCHTDYVPEQQRGKRFHISDGIGCEACHGGAEAWIDSHYGPDTSHADNLRQGMAPTEKPLFQARMCQSCHLGNGERQITHEMMAAGHPRLRFELDTWLVNMPPHHVVDDDYSRRKNDAGGVERWVASNLAASDEYLSRLADHIGGDSLAPELSLFDCHACHRPMDTGIRRTARERRLIPAGSLRPNDHALRMLGIIVELRDPDLAQVIRTGNRNLHAAAAQTASDFRSRAIQLRKNVALAAELFRDQRLSADDRRSLETTLLQRAADGWFRDYADAEQLFLGLQSLAAQVPATTSRRYDALFRLLDDEQAFEPGKVAAEAGRLLRESR